MAVTATSAGKLPLFKKDRSGLDAKDIDINKDGVPDQHIYSKNGKIVFIERDFNFDGKIDMTEIYENDAHVRDEFDLNYDGIVDLIVSYQNGVVSKKEYSIDFDENRHGLQIFDEKGNCIEIRRDTDRDGAIDKTEYYHPGETEPYKVEKKDSTIKQDADNKAPI